MLNSPACRQRSLDRIERTLLAEEPVLGLRFAVFTRLTLNEAMPGTERVPERLQRRVRTALLLPLMVISLLALLAASWLIPSSQQACPVGKDAPAHTVHSLNRAGSCQLAARNLSRPPGAGSHRLSP